MHGKRKDPDQRREDGGSPLVRVPWLHLGTRLDPQEPGFHAIDKLCRVNGLLIAELGQPWSGLLVNLDALRTTEVEASGRKSRIVAAVRWTTDTAWIDDETWIHLLTEPERDEIVARSLAPIVERIERYYRSPARTSTLERDNPVRDLLSLGRARRRRGGPPVSPKRKKGQV